MPARTWSRFEATWDLEAPTLTKLSSRERQSRAGSAFGWRGRRGCQRVGAPVLRLRTWSACRTMVASRVPLSTLEFEPVRERAAVRRRVLSAGVDLEGFILQRRIQLGTRNREQYRRKIPMRRRAPPNTTIGVDSDKDYAQKKHYDSGDREHGDNRGCGSNHDDEERHEDSQTHAVSDDTETREIENLAPTTEISRSNWIRQYCCYSHYPFDRE